MKTQSLNNNIDIVSTEKADMITVNKRSDGIIHAHISASEELNVAALKKLTVLFNKMNNSKNAPLLFTLEDFVLPSIETRKFWAKKEACPYSSADAILSSNLALKIIVNFYLKINKPERPTKLFVKEEEAIKWLKRFL